MGMWSFCDARFRTTFKQLQEKRTMRYIGRDASASPATGQYEIHLHEMTALIEAILA